MIIGDAELTQQIHRVLKTTKLRASENMKCPSCKKRSLRVNEDKGLWKCSREVCAAGGTAITWAMYKNGWTLHEALERLDKA